jgi:shikimate dehydrogenase
MVTDYNDDELAHLRKDIDFLDDETMKFLVKRFEITKKIRRYKKANNLPVMDKDREEHIIREKTVNSGLPRKFIKDFYKLIFEESRRIQR